MRAQALAADTARRPLPDLDRALITLEFALGIGAVVGGLVLVAEPDGSLLELPLALLDSTPFTSFLIPGLLLTALGVFPLVVATRAVSHGRTTGLTHLTVGLVLLVWMVSQLSVLGTGSVLQAVYLGLAIAICTLAAFRLSRA